MTLTNNSQPTEIVPLEDIYYKEPDISIWVCTKSIEKMLNNPFLKIFRLSAFWIALVGIIGVFSNTLAILVILLTKKVLLLFKSSLFDRVSHLQLWTDFNMLVLNLLVTELLVSTIGLPMEFVAAYQYGWKMGETVCKASGFLFTVLGAYILHAY